MHILRDYQLEEVPDGSVEAHYEIPSFARHYGPTVNATPIGGSVQEPRKFFGGRFTKQALSLTHGEAPLVQALDPEHPQGWSFDQILGSRTGITRATKGGHVTAINPDTISVRYDDGKREHIGIFNNVASNQKSGTTSRPVVKVGDHFEPGHLLAATNFTDDHGVLAMGRNARVAMAPYKGHSIDDGIPISESFAKSLESIHYKKITKDFSDHFKAGVAHFRAHFPTRFEAAKYANFTDDGMVKQGTILKPGDPVLLGTTPHTTSSAGVNLGRLAKPLQQAWRNASLTWDEDVPAEVLDARQTKNGYKVTVKYHRVAQKGDKLDFRAGAKGVISKIIPDDQMPRTEDGKPVDVLLNPLSLVSRANPSTHHEIRLGKIAKALGHPLKVPSYLPPGSDWRTLLNDLEQQTGVQSQERLYDPASRRFLSKPVTVGYAYMNRLHHVASGKVSDRGQGAYDVNGQPLRGGGSEAAQAKRFSGLETNAALSAGAYALLGENSTLKGQKNDDFWWAMRSGKPLPKVGSSDVFHKFFALLGGGGVNARDLGNGQRRLAPFTDADLEKLKPVEVRNGEMVDFSKPDTMPAIKGGLFDPELVTGNRWGRIRLPRPVVNPAYREAARTLLGLTGKDFDAVLRGEKDLPPELLQKLKLAKP